MTMPDAPSSTDNPNALLPEGWISAGEDLPAPETRVLVVAWKHGREESRQTFEATYTGDGVFQRREISFPITTSHIDAPIYYRVTDWTPLPIPPEKLGEYPEQKEGSRQTRVVEQKTSHLG